VTAQGSARARFNRARDHAYLWGAEEAAREMGKVSLDEALRLVYLYAEAGSPRFERAAMRWMERYMAESEPSVMELATMASRLAEAGQEHAA
jgi:hypothetical protein